MERKELYANIKASRYDKRKMDELRISPEAQDLISKVFYTIYGGWWFVTIYLLTNQLINQPYISYSRLINIVSLFKRLFLLSGIVLCCVVLCSLDFCSFCHGAIVSSGDASPSMGNRHPLILIATPV